MGEQAKKKAPRGVDRRGQLEERPFTYIETKDGKVMISRDNRLVTILSGKAAEKFINAAEGLSQDEVQLLLAKATGHYKHGNER